MKPVKVVAFEWNTSMLIKVLVELKARHNWEPVYCVSYGLRDELKAQLPLAVYHDTFDARYGRPAPELGAFVSSVLDQPTALALAQTQVLALKQMDRMELLDGFSQRDRFMHFHRLAGYWSAIFDQFKPDVIVMPTSPHVVYDLIGYSLAKLRGIPTVLFEYVTTEGLLAAIDGFENGIPQLMAKYREAAASPVADVSLSNRLEDYWKRLRGDYSGAVPWYTRELWAKARTIRQEQEREDASLAKPQLQNEVSGSKSFLHRLDLAMQILRNKQNASTEAPAAEKKPPSTDGHFKGQFYKANEVPEDLARDAANHRRQNADASCRNYSALATRPRLDEPYVYVALHIQPERSTNPNGGVFDDQQVLIGLVARTIPQDWKVYVKEHPSQFVPQYASERGRSPSFYDAILEHPNVCLVDQAIPSFDLIDNARAVATITGTSSWEALVRGVPTMVFGEAWYKGCPGAHDVRSKDDCRAAVARIAAGEKPDPMAVRRFLRAAEDVSFVGYLSSDDEPIAGIDESTNVDRLTGAIFDCYSRSRREKL